MNKRKVCWKITSNCNLDCKYCFRVLNCNELTYKENQKILMKLIEDGVTDITWNGGEPLIYPYIFDLLKIAKENGVKNKLITNGKLLLKDNNLDKVRKYVDNLTISLDTVNSKTNIELCGDEFYIQNVKSILEYYKNNDLKINVNTVVNKKNLKDLNDLGKFLNNYEIDSWKFIEFSPFRDTAKRNKNDFFITNVEFETTKFLKNSFKNIKNIEFRTSKELEKNNLIIVPNGEIIKTENGKDIKIGNAISDNIVKILEERENRMIRTLIAYDDEEIKDEMINLISNIENVEIVGTATDGEETYKKIIELNPEMVFTKYDLEKMDGLEIIKKSRENMEQMPVFNIISDKTLGSEVAEMVKVAGTNLNSLIDEDEKIEKRVKNIFKEYKQFKNS